MLTRDEAERRVAKGAAYLDHFWPGWYEQIDVDTLDMSESCGCIVGQLTGDYNDNSAMVFGCVTTARRRLVPWREVEVVDEERKDAYAYGFGFDVPKNPIVAQRAQEFLRLKDAWIGEIARRLHPDAEERDNERSEVAQPVDAVGQRSKNPTCPRA